MGLILLIKDVFKIHLYTRLLMELKQYFQGMFYIFVTISVPPS